MLFVISNSHFLLFCMISAFRYQLRNFLTKILPVFRQEIPYLKHGHFSSIARQKTVDHVKSDIISQPILTNQVCGSFQNKNSENENNSHYWKFKSEFQFDDLLFLFRFLKAPFLFLFYNSVHSSTLNFISLITWILNRIS